MKILTFIVVIGMGTPMRSASAKKATDWSWKDAKEGVSLYTKPVRGSEIPMVKAVTTVNARPRDVWETIKAGKMNVSGLKERRQIGTCGSGCEYVYVRIGNFLISDRHYVVKIESEETIVNGNTQFTRSWIQSKREKPQGKNAAMEIKHIRGSWKAAPMDGGTKTQLTYTNHLDLGGYVPSVFFAPKFVDKTYDIIAKIKEEV